jgi:hypothetical protein
VRRRIREILGIKKGARFPANMYVEQWFGISRDEIIRMKDPGNDDPWAVFRYTLIETQMSRQDCDAWLTKRGINAPKSACGICPYTSRIRWEERRKNDPEGFELANCVDQIVRRGMRGVDSEAYLHRDKIPLVRVGNSPQIQIFDADEMDGACSGNCFT